MFTFLYSLLHCISNNFHISNIPYLAAIKKTDLSKKILKRLIYFPFAV